MQYEQKEATVPSRRSDQTVARVHEALKRQIIAGDYAADQPLSQLKIAEALGISRTPLREVFRLLEQDGLVISEHNKRFRVAGFSPDDLEELYALRIAIESAAIAMSVPRLDADDLAAIDAHLEAMDAATASKDYDAWSEPHRRFHRLLIHRAGPRFTRMAEQLSDHAERYRHASMYVHNIDSWEQGKADHHGLRDAAQDRDSIGASERIAVHYGRVALQVLSSTAPLHNPSRLRSVLSAPDLA